MKSGSGQDHVACVGCGVVGSAWAALFASRGMSVSVQDPSPQARALLERTVSQAAQALGASTGELLSRIKFTLDPIEALHDASFVQESVPDSLALKQRVYAELGRLVPPQVVIASSTSGFPISEIQAHCEHPERTVVGHPINPPYAVRLVEVVGGGRTSEATIARACEFYRSAGCAPLPLGREVFGFVANRLQLALLREALQMIARGEATVSQVDHALMHGIGPRWAAVGVFGAFVLNLAEPDVERWLEHFEKIGFGESSVHTEAFSPWTPQLRQSIAQQWNSRVDAEGSAALRERRDAIAIGISRLRESLQ